MAVADINKAEIVQQNARGANDTGSPEVQVALLTARINELTPISRQMQRSSQPSWLVEDGLAPPPSLGLPQGQRSGPLSRADRQTRLT